MSADIVVVEVEFAEGEEIDGVDYALQVCAMLDGYRPSDWAEYTAEFDLTFWGEFENDEEFEKVHALSLAEAKEHSGHRPRFVAVPICWGAETASLYFEAEDWNYRNESEKIAYNARQELSKRNGEKPLPTLHPSSVSRTGADLGGVFQP